MSFLRKSLSILMIMALIGSMALTTGCRSKSPEEKFEEAMELLQERNVPLSILKLQEIVSDDPNSDIAQEAQLMIARIFVGQGDANQAVRHLTEIYRRRGVNDWAGQEALNGLVEVFSQIERLDDAIQLLEEGIANSQNEELRENLVREKNLYLLAHDDEERNQEALNYFRTRMMESEREEARGEAREIIARYYRIRQEYLTSNEIYDEYESLFPNDPMIKEFNLAKALNLKGAANLENAEERFGKSPDELMSEAERLFEEGVNRMKAEADEELNLNRRAEIQSNLAQYYEFFGKLDEAEQVYRTIMSEHVRSVRAISAQFEIAGMYLRNHKTDKARDIANQIIQENPNTNLAQQAEMIKAQAAQVDEYLKALAEMAANAEEGAIETLQGATEEIIEEVEEIIQEIEEE